MSDNVVALIKALLNHDPGTRMTANGAMDSPWLQGQALGEVYSSPSALMAAPSATRQSLGNAMPTDLNRNEPVNSLEVSRPRVEVCVCVCEGDLGLY